MMYGGQWSDFIARHPLMWGLLLMAVVLLVYEWGQQYYHLYGLGIVPQEAVRLMNEKLAQVVEVTHEPVHAAPCTHGIAGAIRVDLAGLKQGGLAGDAATVTPSLITPARPVILVGEMRVLETALRVLAELGCRERYYLSGGMASWQAAGLPLQPLKREEDKIA